MNNPKTDIQRQALSDGRIRFVSPNGGELIVPPLPGEDWQDRKAQELAQINQAIFARNAPDPTE